MTSTSCPRTSATRVVGHDVGWARAYGLCQDDIFSRYMSTLFQRPSAQKAFADLGDSTLSTLEVPEGKAAVKQRITG